VLSFLVVTKCYSYGKIDNVILNCTPPGEDPTNRLNEPNPRLKSLIHVIIGLDEGLVWWLPSILKLWISCRPTSMALRTSILVYWAYFFLSPTDDSHLLLWT
jgi:hypothetical protein